MMKGWCNMKEKLKKLLDVKSLVTLGVTGVFCYLSLKCIISAELFMTVYTTIIAFYFGVQVTKAASDKEQKGLDKNE